MHSTPPQISIIIPCFNEYARLAQTINVLLAHLKHATFTYEIILVDDGSTDQTRQLMQQQPAGIITLSYQPNRGKGYAINQGIKIANGSFILFMDADLATDINEINAFMALTASTSADIIIGVRSMATSKQPPLRLMLGRVFMWLNHLILQLNHQDINCGFKLFTRKAAEFICARQHIYRWSFDAELLFIANQHHFRILEQPVNWQHRPHSKVNVLRDALLSFIEILFIRIYAWRGHYR